MDKDQEIPAELVFEIAHAFWHQFICDNEVASAYNESDEGPDPAPGV